LAELSECSFDYFSWALAGFVGATLTPTDAALSAQVINDQRVPMRLRRALKCGKRPQRRHRTPIVTFTLHSSTISALNSRVNERRGLGFFLAMDSMMNILPGPKPLIRDVRQNGSSSG
jgi:hypothetical protein